MGRRGYPAEFRRRVLDLIETGRRVADLAVDLGITEQTIYNWRRQDRIDQGLGTQYRRTRGVRRGTTAHPSSGSGNRGASLATELLKGGADPKAIRGHRSDGRRGLVVETACRVLEVSVSVFGFYA